MVYLLLLIIKKFNHFFKNNEIVFYHNKTIYLKKLNIIKIIQNKKKIAYNGQKKYFELFNEIEVSKYIVNASLGIEKYNPIWNKYLK